MKAKGTIYFAIPTLLDSNAVAIGGDFAIAAPAKDASATGGVIVEGSAGQANTGGGGGGGGSSSNLQSRWSGGSGVVILRMPTAKYSGTTTGSPTVTTDGTDTILTYTSSGTYTA